MMRRFPPSDGTSRWLRGGGGLAIAGEVTRDDETTTVMPAIPSARFGATNVDHFERRAAHRDSAEKSLDHLCRIRARLLDLDDDGRLDACSAARLGDVEAEIAAIREARAVRFRETDPGWARLEELARQG